MSSSKLLKCSSCNIVVCEALAFIQNKLDVMDEESLVRICESAFSESDIQTAKSLLFESVNKRVTVRKRKGKSQRNLDDIIHLFKDTDPEQLPTFVARDLDKLPPISFDHVDVTTLLKKIVVLQKTVDDIKHSYVTNKDLEDRLREYRNFPTCEEQRNVNTRRGGTYSYMLDSGPMALSSNMTNIEQQEDVNDINKSLPSHSHTETCPSAVTPDISLSLKLNRPPQLTPLVIHTCNEQVGESDMSPLSTLQCNSKDQCPITAVNESADRQPTDRLHNLSLNKNSTGKNLNLLFSDIMNNKETEWKEPTKDEQWILVQKKRLRNRFISKKGIADSESCENIKFKAADTKVPLFISNVHEEVSDKDIFDYVLKKTGEKISLVKIKMAKQRDYNAYKVFVSKSKIDMFLDDNLWPSGISFRRFVNFGFKERQLRGSGGADK